MKKALSVFLALCLLAGAVALAESAAPKTSYESREVDMPAAGVLIYAPDNMDSPEGDEVAADLGFRFNCTSDTFDLTIWVHDSRDMNLADYAAFDAARNGQTAAAETINGIPVQRLTSKTNPKVFDILVAMPDDPDIQAVYDLTFTCDGKKDVALAEEILSTLALWGY